LFEEDDNMFWFIKDGLIFVPKKKNGLICLSLLILMKMFLKFLIDEDDEEDVMNTF
jgi:hypothetical protein